MGLLLNGAVVSALASVLGKRGLLGEAGSKHAENLKLIAKALGTAFVVKLLARFARWYMWRGKMNSRFLGPPAQLVMGNLGDLQAAGGFNEKFFNDLHGKYGKTARFWILGALNISVTDVQEVLEVYEKCSSRPHETWLFLNYMGKENLLFLHGKAAKDMRLRYGKLIQPREVLEKLSETTAEIALKQLVPKLAGGTPKDIHKELGPVIYNIMGKTIFGGEWLKGEGAIGQKIYKLHVYLIENAGNYAFYPFEPWYDAGYRKYRATIVELRKVCGKLLAERRAEEIKNPSNRTDALTLICTNKADDGSYFFDEARGISAVIGLLNGAYDTTHATTTWFLYHVAKFPAVQARLLQEIDSIKGVPATLELTRDFEYMHAVLQESIRMVTTVPVNQRVNLDEDVTIGGQVVPKGSNINIPMFVMFKNEKYFGPKPLEFNPDRFLGSSAEAERARNSWIPFGERARKCVGLTFAFAEMKPMITTILQNYSVKLKDGSAPGTYMIEAGVNQPTKPHFELVFEPRAKK